MGLPELLANSPTPGQALPIATLTTTLSIAGTTLQASAPAPAALQGTGQFRIVIDSEILLVTAGASGTSWTVQRGVEGSTATAHFNKSQVFHYLTAGALGAFMNPAAIAGGSLGSTYALSLGGIPGQTWLTGTLTANCTITISNRAAGCRVLLLLTQDGTGGRTLSISDGGASSPIPIPLAPNAIAVIEIDCPNSTDLFISALSSAGANRVVTVTQSATPAINTDTTDVASITGLAQAITSMTTNLTGTPIDGQVLLVRITDNGTGRAITWGASFEASTVPLPTTTVASAMLCVEFLWNTATSKWRCVGVA